MLADFIAWTTHLNETNRLAFATITELAFKVLGIQSGKSEHHH